MSRSENADFPSPQGKMPLSKVALASATFAGLGLLGAAAYLALLIAFSDYNNFAFYSYDNDSYNPLLQNGFCAGTLFLGASLVGLLLGFVAVNSPEVRSGAERGRPLAIVAIVLGLIAILMSCWLMFTNFL